MVKNINKNINTYSVLLYGKVSSFEIFIGLVSVKSLAHALSCVENIFKGITNRFSINATDQTH